MAKLTAKKRKRLKASTFGLPAERKYPLTDANHARNALARVEQNGTPAEKAAVRKKVAKRFPQIKQSKGPSASKTGKKGRG